MDFVKNLAGGNKDNQTTSSSGEQKSSGGFMDKLNNAAGGGAAGEKKEDGLDKGNAKLLVLFPVILVLRNSACLWLGLWFTDSLSVYLGVDWVQENVLGQGNQSNESALEQAKDEQISGMFIQRQRIKECCTMLTLRIIDFIRDKYKAGTGKDFPVADK